MNPECFSAKSFYSSTLSLENLSENCCFISWNYVLNCEILTKNGKQYRK